MSEQNTFNSELEQFRNLGNQAGLLLWPEGTVRRTLNFMNALSNLRVINGTVNFADGQVVIKIDDPRISQITDRLSALENDYLDLETDVNGDLVFNSDGTVRTSGYDGSSGGSHSGRNDFGTGNSGGTDGGSGGGTEGSGTTGGAPTGSGGANNSGTSETGGGSNTDSLPDPAAGGVRLYIQGGDVVRTLSPTASVTVTAVIINNTGVAATNVRWTTTMAGRLDPSSPSEQTGETATFLFDTQGQGRITLRATVDGRGYVDEVNVSIVTSSGATFTAGEAQTVDGLVDPSTALTGSFSTGQDTEWKLISGDSAGAQITDPSSPTTTVGFTAGGTYVFQLTSKDDPTLSDTVTITVENLIPFSVICIPKTTVAVTGEQGNLSAYVSQPGSLIWWEATKTPGGSLPSIVDRNSASTPVFIFQDGLYTFKITGTWDGKSNNDSVNLRAGPPPAFAHMRCLVSGATGNTIGARFAGQWQGFIEGGSLVSWGGSSFARSNTATGVYTSAQPSTSTQSINLSDIEPNGDAPSKIEFQYTDDYSGGALGSSWWTLSTHTWKGHGSYYANGSFIAD